MVKKQIPQLIQSGAVNKELKFFKEFQNLRYLKNVRYLKPDT